MIVYLPKAVLRYRPIEKLEPLKPVSILMLKELVYQPKFMVDDEVLFRKDRYVYYIVPRKTRLKHIVRKFPILVLNELETLNDAHANQVLQPGTKIKLRKKW